MCVYDCLIYTHIHSDPNCLSYQRFPHTPSVRALSCLQAIQPDYYFVSTQSRILTNR